MSLQKDTLARKNRKTQQKKHFLKKTLKMTNFNKNWLNILFLISSKQFYCHKKPTSNHLKNHEKLYWPLETDLLKK